MCYLVETVSLDNTVHRISELEGALEIIAKPPSCCPSPPLGAGEGAESHGDQTTRSKSSSGRHQAHLLQLPVQAVPAPGPLCERFLGP